MAKSLLAHLYTHIKGSQEDVATLALHYILTQSKELNKAFTKKISKKLNIGTDEFLQYATQITGENKERPDMVGVDNAGKEVVLCEMKFYAGLTENQPLGYLKRLEENNGKGLLFVCPKSRISTLWYELSELCDESGKRIEEIANDCLKINDVNMSIITWSEIIETLMNMAEAYAENLIPDIKQLKGYCEQIDSEAFIPFKPEELSAINAKKAERFYLIIDKVSELILTDRKLRYIKNSSKAGNRDGYISYLYVNDYAIAICYDRYFWSDESCVDTPFWLSIKKDVGEKSWKQTTDIINQLKRYPDSIKVEYNSVIYLALRVQPYATEDEVCKNIKEQILNYLSDIDNSNNDELIETTEDK